MHADERRCYHCRAALRPGHAVGLCADCARLAGLKRPIPSGFYDKPALRTALAAYDFGTVFRAVRQQTGLSQLRLAELVELSQPRVSEVERGKHHLRDIRLLVRISAALGIPASLLGFASESAGSVEAQGVSWVQRRDFLNLVTSAVLGSNLHPELARLDSLLPAGAEPITRPHIGVGDVEAIEAVTSGLRAASFSHGGETVRAAALAQLRHVRQLTDAQAVEAVRMRLYLAIADLAQMAAYACYDATDHDAARRLWTYALDLARQAETEPRSVDLTVSMLLDSSEQAQSLGRPREALQLAQLAGVSATQRKYPAGPITRSYTSAVLGQAWAALGEVEASTRALGESWQHYAQAEPGKAPPWAQWLSAAEIEAEHGNALFVLAAKHPASADMAIQRLHSALAGMEPQQTRPRAYYLTCLAGSYFRAGEVEAGANTGLEALGVIRSLSTVPSSRLRLLEGLAQPHRETGRVGELLEGIGEVG